MKVLHVIPTLASRTGGPPVAVVESSLALRDLGVETTVASTDLAEAASASRHSRVTVAEMPDGAARLNLRTFPARWPRRLAFSPGLYASLSKEAAAYDIIHVHSLFLFPQFAAYRHAVRSRVPYVVSPRGALDPYLRQRSRGVKAFAGALWQRAFLERASALHVTSDDERRLIADIAPHVPRFVVPNGIRSSAYARLPDSLAFRRRYLPRVDAPLVMYLGRISHKKGLDLLIESLVSVCAGAPGCHLAIVGPDDENLVPSLRALAEKHGVAGAVTFTGMLSGERKLEALAAADVWALPSHSENFGNAVVEAMAASRPVVVSPAVNIAAEIAEAGAGVVAELTPAAFAGAIVPLLRDPHRREQLGAAARVFARRYDWAAVAPRMKAMYESILRSN
jgi:glycosyltransferase involved in cell wall biosynthesis